MIRIKSREEIALMREGGRCLAKIMEKIKNEVVPGKTTIELDKLAESLVFDYGGIPSFKGYNGFPATLCASLNDEIVHGLPSDRCLKSGDIISLDIGMFYKGFHTDIAVTIPVGSVEPETLRLIKTARKALKRGIKKARPGNTFGDLGNTIQRCIEGQGFTVINGLCGHGIGRNLHEEPEVPNFGKRRSGPELKKGMVFCIEPMISSGDCKIEEMSNGFTFKTKDGSLSAHFEHTVAVTENGCEILTELFDFLD